MKNFFNKKFSTKTKLISSAISMMLIVCFAITGTVAWLTAKTDTVPDTFTFGKVEIKLIDATNNNVEWSATVHKNAYDAGLYTTETTDGKFKLIPGASFDFNPAVKVLDGSESCYVFVKIEVPANLAAAIVPLKLTDWTPVAGQTNVYAYTPGNVFTKVEKNGECIIVKDNQMVTKTSATLATLEAVGEDVITITAYAIQSEYLTDANSDGTISPEEAWALFNS